MLLEPNPSEPGLRRQKLAAHGCLPRGVMLTRAKSLAADSHPKGISVLLVSGDSGLLIPVIVTVRNR